MFQTATCAQSVSLLRNIEMFENASCAQSVFIKMKPWLFKIRLYGLCFYQLSNWKVWTVKNLTLLIWLILDTQCQLRVKSRFGTYSTWIKELNILTSQNRSAIGMSLSGVIFNLVSSLMEDWTPPLIRGRFVGLCVPGPLEHFSEF